jgi:hypothetical protein
MKINHPANGDRFPAVWILNLPQNAKCCGARLLRGFRVASPQINHFVHFHSDGEAA